MRAAYLFMLVASLGLASPLDQTRGGNLKRRQYQTGATFTLFMDPAGSDSNSCTSASNACLTFNGVLQKLPRFVIHSGTVTVASGTYTTAFSGTTPVLTPIAIGQGVGITFSGTMVTSTVATGTATGTCTSAAAGTASGPATCTDSGQSWTVDDLKGKFITFGSGSLSGQSFPITTNSATVVTFPSTTSSGVVTYSIQEPGAIFSTSGANFPTNFSGNGNLTFTNLKFNVSAGNGISFASTAATGINIVYQSVSVSSSSVGLNFYSGDQRVRRSYITSSGSYGIFVDQSNPSWAPTVQVANSFIRAPAALFTGIYVAAQTEMATSPISATAIEVSTGVGVQLQGGSSGQNVGVWVTCTTAGSGTGIIIGKPVTTTATGTWASHSFNGSSRITGCGTGFRVASAPASASVGAIAFDTVTTAFSVTKGGIIDFVSATPTFTTVTTELDQDGTAYTFADLTALPAPQVITNSYGSRYIR